jgi:hypothetical protein
MLSREAHLIRLAAEEGYTVTNEPTPENKFEANDPYTLTHTATGRLQYARCSLEDVAAFVDE